MPTNLPSSFASAAAGQNANRDSRGGRSDGRGVAGGDWSRRDGRSANGTMTFRRASTTPLGVGSQPPPPIETPTSPVATDSAAAASSYDLSSARYSRDDLLDMFGPGKPRVNLDSLFIPGWDPSLINGNSGRGWGKSNENHVPQEPGACWDPNGETTPMGLQSLSTEEKEAFATDINSPLKPPTQNKDGHQTNVNGRKASLSQGSGNAFGITSPTTTTRPGTRRRETQDSNPFAAGGLGSPTATNRFGRDDQASWLPKKSSDLREGEADDPTGDSSSGRPGLGNLMRSNTAGSAGLGSMWPSSNPTTPNAGGFGSFSMSSAAAIGDKRGPAGGSRLAHLMPREGSDSAGLKTAEVQSPGNQQSWRSRPRTDTDPFGEDELSGSAVLGGSQDVGSGGVRAGLLGTPVKGSTDDFGMSGLHLNDDKDQNSPSGTNPYRSPPAERREQDDDELGGAEKSHGQSDQAGFGAFGRGFGGPSFDAGDRSQTSSVGAKGYPIGSLSGWPAPGPSTNTPDRDRGNFGGAFGSSLFGGMGDLQSPGLGNLGNVFGPSAAGSIGRGSKLGSLFPAAMQAQMQSHDPEAHASEGGADMRQNNPLGAIGRGAFGMPPRDTESPMRSNRGVFEDLFPSSDTARGHGAFPGADGQQAGTGTVPQSFTPVSGGLPFGGQAGGEPPSAQVRQMVMPDRMRWVYLDPQGQVQGPFTGLEMNDWYKANFFTPDLRVKKVEDTEFEPLGQLIRRIGNSREPFLVPQIGVPHGPPSQTGPFNNTAGVVPPLSGVFPSFGRTLTAEEQNNLERRKQEEQYLAAQQREYMMRQGPLPKFPIAGGQNLQHHSSAQSLQSQPSFGSISGPMGMPQQQPSIASMQSGGGFNDGASGMHSGARPGAGSGDMFRQEDLSNLTSTERELLASMDGADKQQQQPIGASADQAGRSELPDTTDLEEDEEGFKGRLQQFEDLRSQHDAAQAAVADNTAAAVESLHAEAKAEKSSKKNPRGEDSSLSLTEQVQIAQAAAAAQPGEPGLPMPFPPPSSQTPLPAPTAQRVRSNLPEQYSRSQSATPEVVQPPPLAPWAKEPGNGPKGPSLKEIQEAEARKAAKAEEVADALRKAAAAQEHALARERERVASAAANAAALPASSTWGHGSPSATTTPWSKPGSVKPSTSGLSTTSSNSKKTLADIQREEEARKQKARDVSAQTGVPAPSTKSYANLAGKPSYASPMASPSAAASMVATQPPPPGWSMVGAGGKVKTPGATGVTGVQSRSTSISSAKPSPIVTAAKPSPKPMVAAIQTRSDGASTAVDEFNKWVNRELSKGITGVTDIAAFQNDLASFPLETGIIADAVYSQSTTMDGRHFAEEYVRRKRLAEKGIIEKQTAADRSASGGWSEVAKKGGNSTVPREADNSTAMQAAGFKVVPSRKKGKK